MDLNPELINLKPELISPHVCASPALSAGNEINPLYLLITVDKSRMLHLKKHT